MNQDNLNIMKSITLARTKNILTLCFVLSILVFQQSCKKADLQPDETKATNEKFRTSDIVSYLQQQKNPLTPKRNLFVSQIADNLLLNNTYSESLHGNETLIIVPLREVYFSKNIGNKHPLQYLILAKNTQGEIRKASLVLFEPKNLNVKSLPNTTFEKFFKEEKLPLDGTLTLINLFDVKQFEADFTDGNKTQLRLWKKTQTQNLGGTNCQAWYMVTTWYNADGTVQDEDWYYLGTTCDGDEQSVLTGGSGSNHEPQYRSLQKFFTYYEEQSAYTHWSLTASFVLEGYSCDNPSDNVFTNAYGSASAILYHTPANNQNPLSLAYTTYHEDVLSVSYSGGSATGTAGGTISLPNMASQNGGVTPTAFHSGSHTWTAAIDLF